MPANNPNTILIVEPKKELANYYQFLPRESSTIHVLSTQHGIKYLQNKTPSLVTISASYSPLQIFHFLETLKESSHHRQYLIPLLFVIDLDHETNFIPGTYWGQKLGIINSLSSNKETQLVLKRICQPQPSLGY